MRFSLTIFWQLHAQFNRVFVKILFGVCNNSFYRLKYNHSYYLYKKMCWNDEFDYYSKHAYIVTFCIFCIYSEFYNTLITFLFFISRLLLHQGLKCWTVSGSPIHFYFKTVLILIPSINKMIKLAHWEDKNCN